MALLYRAIWEDERDDLLGDAGRTTLDWLRGKGVELEELPVDTEIEGRFLDPRFGTEAAYRLTTGRAVNQDVEAFRVTFVEDRSAEGQRWTTALTAIRQAGVAGTLWVDVERYSDDPFAKVPFRAPKLVKTLIESGKDPKVGHVRLEPRAVVIPVAGLAGLIRNEERRLPVVVFSHDDRAGAEATLRRAQAAYDHLAGVAQVFILPESDVEAFKLLMTEELAVWGGGARLYLPNRGNGGLRPQRHRYVPGQSAARFTAAAAEVFVSMLSSTVPATPAPKSYDKVRTAMFAVGATDEAELLTYALEENTNLFDENEVLRIRIEQANDSFDELGMEFEDLTREFNRAQAHFSQVIRDLAAGGSANVVSTNPALPDEVTTITEAIEWARELPNLTIPDDAPVDIVKLESATNASAWANTIWRAFRALDAYASDPGQAGFWEWCQVGDSVWTWPATPKKLSMTESEGVQNNDRLRSARMLPVSREVHKGGKVEMLAHIKIAQGGGPLAPRIYFHDDVRGPTRKIHVGFIGPHEHMPNLSTN